ncbi:hypothetical protein F4806DRAFT_470224 [Annulohypoxylon nitens]|nr:hypothetical protein F4806DRAFT_470224 [Annulohypoxylon nitens]
MVPFFLTSNYLSLFTPTCMLVCFFFPSDAFRVVTYHFYHTSEEKTVPGLKGSASFAVLCSMRMLDTRTDL